MKRPEMLYEQVVEVEERVRLVGAESNLPADSDGTAARHTSYLNLFWRLPLCSPGSRVLNFLSGVAIVGYVQGTTLEWVEVLKKPNLEKLEADLKVPLICCS
jgi:hypothetical protein